MEYPRKPSFANIFWYQVVTNDGSTWLCTTTGLEFVYELQRVLQEAGIPSAPSYDGVSAGSADIEADGIWGPTTQRVLYLAATQPGTSAGIPVEFITALAANGRSHFVGFSSVYVAIYIIMTLSANSGLFIESGTGLEILRVQAFDPPQWGVRPPAVGVHNPPRNLTCVLQIPSETPGVSTVPEDAPAGTPAQPAAPRPGTSAPPIAVGPAATRVDVNVPPGRQPTTVIQEGITIGPILVAAGVLGLIVWGTSEIMKARRNPSLRQDTRLAELQQDVMRELDRTDLWSRNIRSSETASGNLEISGHTELGDALGDVYRETRIPQIAEAHGFVVVNAGTSLIFRPRHRPNPRAPRDLLSKSGLDILFREQGIAQGRFPYLPLTKPEARRVVNHYLGESAKMPRPGYEVALTDRTWGEPQLKIQNMSGSFQLVRYY